MTFLIGAVAGGVTALLLAPRSGEETRQKIREGAHELYERGGNAVSNARDTALDKADSLRGSARMQAGALKEGLSEGKDAYREELKKQKKASA